MSRAFEHILIRKPYVIAEAGVNHNGNVGLAKKLVDVAAEACADAVKFQTFKAEKVVVPQSKKACYQQNTTDPDESQLLMLKKLELKASAYSEIADYCRGKGVTFLSTAFDCESVDLLDRLGVPFLKVPSGEITNFPLIEHVARKKKPVVLSTGMSTLEEVRAAFRLLKKAGNGEIVLMHCVTEYPAPVEEINLQAIRTLQQEFRVPVGYSDHTLGTEVAIAAVGMGAVVIEKHFTLDPSMRGPDHKASVDPVTLKNLVASLRRVGTALGDGMKRPAACEEKNILTVRRSIVARHTIPEGKTLSIDDIDFKRPACGISPNEYKTVVGRIAKRTIECDDVLSWDQLR